MATGNVCVDWDSKAGSLILDEPVWKAVELAAGFVAESLSLGKPANVRVGHAPRHLDGRQMSTVTFESDSALASFKAWHRDRETPVAPNVDEFGEFDPEREPDPEADDGGVPF